MRAGFLVQEALELDFAQSLAIMHTEIRHNAERVQHRENLKEHHDEKPYPFRD